MPYGRHESHCINDLKLLIINIFTKKFFYVIYKIFTMPTKNIFPIKYDIMKEIQTAFNAISQHRI